MPSFLSRIGRSNILLAEVERQLLVQAGELRIGDSRRFKHPLGGAHSDGIRIFIGDVDHFFDAALDDCLCAFVAGEKRYIDFAAIERPTGVVEDRVQFRMAYIGVFCVEIIPLTLPGEQVVVATGMNTEMGKIADALTRAEDEETPLQKKLDELSKILSVICIVICALVFVVTWLKHGMGFFSDTSLVLNTFMVAVSLAVAAIPEGLAAVVTIVLSIGVTKMSQHNAIIRKLSAVETLGCTQIICSDKTGTLTQNKMTVVRHFTEDQDRLVRCMALCSDAKWDAAQNKAVGEPTEAALVADAAKLGFTTGDLDDANSRVGEAPFDSGRKMMSVVNQAPDGNYIQHTKGAPDVILSRCTKIHTAQGDVPMTDEWRKRKIGRAHV